MIAVVSSGMFLKYYLNNNAFNTLGNDKTTMTISVQTNYPSYYSQDFLYFIKDGYTVTKREKIFSYTTTNITAGNIGACEYTPYNQNILLDINYSPTTLSISIIAIGLYFVICGISYYFQGGNHIFYLRIISYNSRGEYISNAAIINLSGTSITNAFYYPKIFNGSGNNIWVFYYTGATIPTLNF